MKPLDRANMQCEKRRLTEPSNCKFHSSYKASPHLWARRQETTWKQPCQLLEKYMTSSPITSQQSTCNWRMIDSDFFCCFFFLSNFSSFFDLTSRRCRFSFFLFEACISTSDWKYMRHFFGVFKPLFNWQ